MEIKSMEVTRPVLTAQMPKTVLALSTNEHTITEYWHSDQTLSYLSVFDVQYLSVL
jgi:hypothetical protein